MRPNLHDTIAALSSAPSGAGCSGARAILRLSGPNAFPLARPFFLPDEKAPAWPQPADEAKEDPGYAQPRKVTTTPPWRRLQGAVRWRESRLPACAYIMPGPRSYTRQDLVEFHLLAPHAALEELLLQLHQAGARMAAPGEFTRRALLNGRLSVSQAAAVGELIRATSADEARVWASRAVRPGRTPPARLREEIEALLALLELGLDFSLEDVTLLPREELRQRLQDLKRKSTPRANTRDDEDGLKWGGAPCAVLLGPTGAGKSTLLNALVGRNVALSSRHGHTTRDPVEALHAIDPRKRVRFTDTAGLDLPGNGPALTRQALALAAQAAQCAELWLIVLDRSAELDASLFMEHFRQLTAGSVPYAAALVWNKADRPSAVTAEQAHFVEAELSTLMGHNRLSKHEVAALSGSGLEALTATLRERAGELQARVSSAWTSSQAAQAAGLSAAREALARAEAAFQAQLGEDAVAVELREAVHALSDAQGVLLRHDALTESLLDRVFSQFCIGK